MNSDPRIADNVIKVATMNSNHIIVTYVIALELIRPEPSVLLLLDTRKVHAV